MSLTDVVSGMNVTVVTQVALVLFLLAFTALLARLFSPSRRGYDKFAASLPLSDESPAAAGTATPPVGS